MPRRSASAANEGFLQGGLLVAEHADPVSVAGEIRRHGVVGGSEFGKGEWAVEGEAGFGDNR